MREKIRVGAVTDRASKRRILLRAQKSPLMKGGLFCADWAACRRGLTPYFGGAGVNPSRLRPGSGLGFGLGAFFGSFLPLSLLPMGASVPQKGTRGKERSAEGQRKGYWSGQSARAGYSPAPPAGLTRTCWGASTFAEETAKWRFRLST
jgi:hypothetical protein